jgi:hypothetical protein
VLDEQRADAVVVRGVRAGRTTVIVDYGSEPADLLPIEVR